jgi:hypothetical protein
MLPFIPIREDRFGAVRVIGITELRCANVLAVSRLLKREY